MNSKSVFLFAWPDDNATDQTRDWLGANGIEFQEEDATTAMHLMLAQEHDVFVYPMVLIRSGDDLVDVFGGYQPDRLQQLLEVHLRNESLEPEPTPTE